jgi:multidrug transporter EmrE-like cation transporter
VRQGLEVTATAAERRKGVALMIAPASLEPGSILVRAPTSATRGRSSSGARCSWCLRRGVLAIQNRGRVLEKIVQSGMPGVWSGLALGATFFFFILSVTQTTVANTLVLMSTGPFFAALAGRLFLGEHVPLRTWIAIAVALAGVVLMFADSLGTGQLAGNLLALGVPIAFAANVVVLRRHRASVDLVPSVLLAGVFSIIVAAPLAAVRDGARPRRPRHDGRCAGQGGCVLMTVASRSLTAGESVRWHRDDPGRSGG